MKFYNSIGPNPRSVRMFMLEKDIEMPFVEHDLLAGENRAEPYVSKNPGGQMPALEFDDGSVLGETVAICEFLEELHPTPTLIGSTPHERAVERQWQRRVELNITENIYKWLRYGPFVDLHRTRMYVIPEAANDFAALVRERLAWLDGLMTARQYLCGDELRLADITLYCALDFATGVDDLLGATLTNLPAWFERIATRDSAVASRHPQTAAIGMRGI